MIYIKDGIALTHANLGLVNVRSFIYFYDKDRVNKVGTMVPKKDFISASRKKILFLTLLTLHLYRDYNGYFLYLNQFKGKAYAKISKSL